MKLAASIAIFASSLTLNVNAFGVPKGKSIHNVRTHRSKLNEYEGPGEDIVEAFDLDSEVSKRGNAALNSEVRSRLLAETIAPWRAVRMFFAASAGSGAFVGGMLTTGSLAAAVSSGADATEIYKNLAIDFGAAAAGAVFFKLDFDKGSELQEKVEAKINRKKDMKLINAAMKQREDDLKNLQVSIQVSNDGQKKEAPIGVLQSGANQHMVLVIGPQDYTRDSLFSAQLVKRDVFARGNTLIVPYTLGNDSTKPSGGFGERVEEKESYVAAPVGEGWESYVQAELNDAVLQGGEDVTNEGIAIVLSNDGTVLRRGVGMIPWKMTVDELNGVDPSLGEKQVDILD